ncbi:hypothetical protein D3C79_631450 [compost metagenome]
MFILTNMHSLRAGQGSANGIGADALFQPAGTHAKALLLARVDKSSSAPGFQELALIITEHDQVTGVAEQVTELRHHFVACGAQQGLLAFEQFA